VGFRSEFDKRKYRVLIWLWHSFLFLFACFSLIELGIEYFSPSTHKWDSQEEYEKSMSITLRFREIKKVANRMELIADCNVKALEAEKRKEIKLFFNYKKEYKTQIIAFPRKESKGENTFDETRPITLMSSGRGLQYFPFDTVIFDAELSIENDLKPVKIRVYNELPGLHCRLIKICRNEKGNSFEIQFKAIRNIWFRIGFIAVVSLSLFFCAVIIWFTDDIKEVAVSVLGYAMSLWSIKSIITSGAKLPIGLIDYLFVIFILLVGFGIIERAIIKKWRVETKICIWYS